MMIKKVLFILPEIVKENNPQLNSQKKTNLHQSWEKSGLQKLLQACPFLEVEWSIS